MDNQRYNEDVTKRLQFFISYFVGRKFGKPNYQRFPIRAEVERYRGVLPDLLLAIWETVGFSAYSNGGLWLVNPSDYDVILKRILKPTVFIEQDIYHVIARNAWGDLILWGEKSGNNLEIVPSMQWICTCGTNAMKDIIVGKVDEALDRCFSSLPLSFMENEDEDDHPMLARATAATRLGKLSEDEMYGFSPFLFMGGECQLKNLQKVNIYSHLELIADMGKFEIIDVACILRSTITQVRA